MQDKVEAAIDLERTFGVEVDQLEGRMPDEMGNVVGSPREQVVDRDDVVA